MTICKMLPYRSDILNYWWIFWLGKGDLKLHIDRLKNVWIIIFILFGMHLLSHIILKEGREKGDNGIMTYDKMGVWGYKRWGWSLIWTMFPSFMPLLWYNLLWLYNMFLSLPTLITHNINYKSPNFLSLVCLNFSWTLSCQNLGVLCAFLRLVYWLCSSIIYMSWCIWADLSLLPIFFLFFLGKAISEQTYFIVIWLIMQPQMPVE